MKSFINVKPERKNAYIILSIFLTIFISYLLIPSNFDDFLRILPGYYHNEDTDRNISELINSRGFIDEIHYIESEDGYILTVHRIINPLLTKNERRELKPIILQHGYQNAASTWLINTSGKLLLNGTYIEYDEQGNELSQQPGNTLAFVLSSSGYDVWLPNYRGNIYSINHTKLNPNKDENFWHFSIDNMVLYDLPAIIKHIQEKTSKKTLSYIGHSQGTIMMFFLLSSRPHYSNIIKPFIALSPNPYLGHIKSPLRHFEFLEKNFNIFSQRTQSTFYFGRVQEIYSRLCENYYLQYICFKIQYWLIGFHSNQFNYNRIGVYLKNLPVGSSSLNSAHILQLFRTNKLQMYDYGKEENLKRYGKEYSPEYPINMINSTNIALIYTANDWLNDLQDVKLLKQQLKVKLLDDYLVPDERWNHMELLWAKEAGKYVNSRILKILSKFNKD